MSLPSSSFFSSRRTTYVIYVLAIISLCVVMVVQLNLLLRNPIVVETTTTVNEHGSSCESLIAAAIQKMTAIDTSVVSSNTNNNNNNNNGSNTRHVINNQSSNNGQQQQQQIQVGSHRSNTRTRSSILSIPNSNCPRFATMVHGKSNGVGHKITEVIFGMLLAEETNATYVFDDAIWFHSGKHGSYPWIVTDRLLFPPTTTNGGIYGTNPYVTMTDFNKAYPNKVRHDHINNKTTSMSLSKKAKGPIHIIDDRWPQLVNDHSSSSVYGCHVMFQTRLHQCCNERPICYCTKTMIGAFERMKWRMRQLFHHDATAIVDGPDAAASFNSNNNNNNEHEHDRRRDRSTILNRSSSDVLTVAWHLRGGDLVLNNNEEYFVTVSQQVAWTLKHVVNNDSFVVYFFGENTTETFPFLPDVCQRYLDGRCLYPTANVQDTFFAMIEADLLITSGSSFPLVAALLRVDGVVLSAFPKEGVVGIYDVSEYGLIAKNGTITKPTSLAELAAQLHLAYYSRRKMK